MNRTPATTLNHQPVDAVSEALTLVCSPPSTGRDERRADLFAVLSRAHLIRRVTDGVIVEFENGDAVARMLLDLVLAERVCCAQFRYAIEFPQNRPRIVLQVTAATYLASSLYDLYTGIAQEAGANVEA